MDLKHIAEELFAKIRGRFPAVTLGDESGNVTTEPLDARYFEFLFSESDDSSGKISISLDEESGVTVMYNNNVVNDEISKKKWYEFLRELRSFSKKRMLNFDVRNITKSNLEKRDYKYLARNSGDSNMNESKLYGTSKLSYQNIDSARLVIKHTENIDSAIPSGRTRNIGTIYIESGAGERFKYPFKHLAGARAMARHVAEGGTTYDDFGIHIVDLSEELSKLRKFKNYMGRSKVMAESLSGYMGIVHERISTVKKRIEHLQKPNFYKEAFDGFEKPVFEEIPEDVKENWIDQLTIRQFNEELKDVFPYIYKLIGEGTRAKELGPEDFMNEMEANETAEKIACLGCDAVSTKAAWQKNNDTCPRCKKSSKGVAEDSDDIEEGKGGFERTFNKVMGFGDTKPKDIQRRVRAMTDDQLKTLAKDVDEKPGDGSERSLQMKLINQELKRRYGIKPSKNSTEEAQIETYFNQLMGEWNEDDAPTKEGFGDKVAKKFNKAMTWGDSSPEEMKKRIRNLSDKELKVLAKRAGEPEGGPGSARSLQMKLINQELKRRYGIKPSKNSMEEACCDGCASGGECEKEAGIGAEGQKDKQSPLSEFILSFYDRANGSFPKGETAVLTMVEKDYGEQYINPAKQFIERVNNTYEQHQASSGLNVIEEPQQDNTEFDAVRRLAGL